MGKSIPLFFQKITNWARSPIRRWLIPSHSNLLHPLIIGTIKQLLKHESGIFNLTDNPLFFQVLNQDYLHVWQDEEIILKLVDKPLFEPGKKYSYSNTNYILLGMLIEKITGSYYYDEVKNKINDQNEDKEYIENMINQLDSSDFIETNNNEINMYNLNITNFDLEIENLLSNS